MAVGVPSILGSNSANDLFAAVNEILKRSVFFYGNIGIFDVGFETYYLVKRSRCK